MYAILSALMSAPGRVFSRVELSRIILDADTVPGRAIDVHISNIRTKIELDIHNPALRCDDLWTWVRV